MTPPAGGRARPDAGSSMSPSARFRRGYRQVRWAALCAGLLTSLASGGADTPRVLRVATVSDYPPFVYREAVGHIDGYVPEWWRRWQAAAGVRVELVPVALGEGEGMLESGEVDVLDPLLHTPERETRYDLGAAYAKSSVDIYVHASVSGIDNRASLRGRQVGVVADTACDELLATGGVRVERYDSLAALLRGALSRQVAVLCVGEEPANHFMYREGVHTVFRQAFQLYEAGLHRAVRRDDRRTRDLIEQGRAKMSAEVERSLLEKWLPPRLPAPAPWLRFTAPLLAGLAVCFGLLLAWSLMTRTEVRRQTRDLRHAQRLLADRVRQQRCLHAVFSATDAPLRPLPEVLREAVQAMLTGWSRPEYVVARIAVDDCEVDSGNFDARVASLSAPVRVGGVTHGSVTVGYAVPRPVRDEGPFTREERQLLEAIAERVSSTVDRLAGAQRLRESEERFRVLFEDTRQAVVLLEDGRCIAANQAALTQLGVRDMKDMVGLVPRDFAPEFQPDGESSAAKAGRALAILERSGSLRLEWTMQRSDGQTFLAEVSLTLIQVDGAAVVHAALRDITDFKQAQAELAQRRDRLEHLVSERTRALEASAVSLRRSNAEQQAIFDTVGCGILVISNFMAVAVNRRFREMFGYDEQQMDGRHMACLFADDADFESCARDCEVNIRLHGAFQTEHRLVRRDGTTFWARIAAQPLAVEEAAAGTFVATFEDISAEHRVLEETRRARDLAEEAARAKADFLANMSHEIRTPMNAVIGMTHLLQKTEIDARQRQHLDQIGASSKHLLSIINDILDVSRTESGKLQLERVPFALEQVVSNACALVAATAAGKGLELVFDCAPEVPLYVVGDPVRLGQVLTNYLNNAVKFTERGEIVVAVSVVEQRGGDVLLRFDVRDTGVGIEAGREPLLFETLQQADAGPTRRQGGAGLGLAIAKRLAALMAGEVGVESEAGKGACFWFTARLGIERRADTATATACAGWRVLVASDNARTAAALRGMLVAAGCEVVVVADGVAALEALRSADAQPYRLCLFDAALPGLPGPAAAAALAGFARAARPRLVLLTQAGAESPLPWPDGALSLQKPVTRTALLEAIARAPAAAASGDAASAAAVTAARASLAGARVLLVEDHGMNRDVVLALLAEYDLSVDVATDGAAAVERVRDGDYALVLMDMQMPLTGGLETTRLIRGLPGKATLPIVAMTANALPGDRERCLDAGMDDYLAKPVNPQQLGTTLSRWLAPVTAGATVPSPAVEPPPPGAPRTGLEGVPGLNVEAGLRFASGRVALYIALVRKFAEFHRDYPQRIGAAVAAGDSRQGAVLARQLKGAAAQVGAQEVQLLALALEKALHEQRSRVEIDALYTSMVAELEYLLRILDQRIPAH
jgi:two-component system sensor histidine kinase/response regulator